MVITKIYLALVASFLLAFLSGAQDQLGLPCPDGVIGILGILTHEATVCCDIECGECGGSACGTRPGGAANCCIGGTKGIVANADDCADSGVAPCVISTEGDGLCSDGIVNSGGTVCCSSECSGCGGQNCQNQLSGGGPRGRENCCESGIQESDRFCGPNQEAPCRLV